MASMNVMDARRYVKVGQIGAVGLGLVAAGLWAAPVLNTELPQKPVVKAEPAPTTPTKQGAVKLDREAAADVADRFEKIASVAKPQPKIEVVDPPKVEEPAPAWAYLGPIQEPSRLLALVKVNDHQKVIAEGRKYGETRLVSVLPDSIVIEDGSGRHTIRLAERGETFSSVAWVKTMPLNTPVTNGANGAQGNPMSPEVAARLRERGINPEEAAQRWRQQMRDRMNRGGGPGGNGGNGRMGQGPDGGAGQRLEGTMTAPMAGDVTRAVLNGQVITTGADGNVTVTKQPGGDDATQTEVPRTRRRAPRGEIN